MDNRKKVPLKNKLAYGIGTGGGNVFSQIAAAFLLNYYTDTALIGAGAIATMFLVCRVMVLRICLWVELWIRHLQGLAKQDHGSLLQRRFHCWELFF